MKVAVIDDHSVFRIGVVSALQSEAAIEIVGEGGSADEAIRIVGEASPDVMLLDIGLPGGGLEAARRIASDFPSVKLIMLTVSDAPGDITNAFAFGAVGYLLKGISSSDLVTAIRQAYQGGTVLAPVLAGRLFGRLAQRLARDRGQDPLHNMLTPREFEVLTLVAIGTVGGSVQTASFAYALPRLSGSGYAVIVSLELVTVVVLGVVLLGERLAPVQVAGVALVVAGVLFDRLIRAWTRRTTAIRR